MKLRYILTTVLACLAFLTGCTHEELIRTTCEVKVEPSYLSIAPEGGQVTIKVIATDDWNITDNPEWLTVTPSSGPAAPNGTEVTLSADVTYKSRNTEFYVNVGDVSHMITVKQSAAVAPRSFEPGDYWIVAQSEGKNYVALPIASAYGYLEVEEVAEKDGKITGPNAAIFTFKAVDGGYTIQDAAGKYYYQTGTYNSFNVVEECPTDGSQIWAVSATGEGQQWKITNTFVSKWMQYSTQYSSFGSYNTVSGIEPILVPAVAGEEDPEPPVVEPEDPETPAELNVVSVADILALGLNTPIEEGTGIEAYVISNSELGNLTSKKNAYLQDETGAIQVRFNADHSFAFGDKVRIDLSGLKVTEYNKALQLSGIANDKVELLCDATHVIEPKTVTMADFLANKYEGQYVAIEGVQVAAADLAKTFVMDGAHTSIAIEDAEGNTFPVFSSKYASFGAQTVPQGSGKIAGIAAKNNDVIQLIFAQESDWAGLTGARFSNFNIDGKQWVFDWEALGVTALFDLGVTAPGEFYIAYDMSIMGEEYAGVWYPYYGGTYTVEDIDGKTGVLKVTLVDPYSGTELPADIPYTMTAADAATFDTSALEALLGVASVSATASAEKINVEIAASAGLADGEYWIIADDKVATPITGKTYGYLNVVDAVNGKSTAANAFTFTQVEAGVYTIQDSNGMYYYQTGSYNSFNISETDGGTEEYLWEVYDTGNGQFVIMNYAQGKFVQYDPNYSSYGSYSDERGVLPYLVLAEDPITE